MGDRTVSPCQICGEETMVTTNALHATIPTPGGVNVVTRLPGAECTTCGTMHLPAGALAILVMDLKGKERLRWKIIDRDHAVVAVDRG